MVIGRYLFWEYLFWHAERSWLCLSCRQCKQNWYLVNKSKVVETVLFDEEKCLISLICSIWKAVELVSLESAAEVLIEFRIIQVHSLVGYYWLFFYFQWLRLSYFLCRNTTSCRITTVDLITLQLVYNNIHSELCTGCKLRLLYPN